MIRVEEGGSWERGGGSNCCFSALVVLSFFLFIISLYSLSLTLNSEKI